MQNLKFVVARHDNDAFQNYLYPCLTDLKNKNPELIRVSEVFNENNDSIFKKYNRGILSLGVSDDDVFCFIHEDAKIIDRMFVEKVKWLFSNKPNIGVLGLIGTSMFPPEGGWWLCDHKYHFGHLIQGLPDGTAFHMNRGIGFNDSLISVDGFCFFLSGKFLKTYKFDEYYYPDAYHFYDVDTCLSAIHSGFSVAVADILLEHKSEGPMPESWHTNKIKFVNKWAAKGFSFPLTLDQFKK